MLTATIVVGVLVGGRLRPATRWLRDRYASRSVARMRLRTAGEVRRQLMSRVQSVHEVRELLHKVLRAHYGLPPGEVTSEEVAACLRQAGVDEELVSACTDLLKACAGAEFAPDFNPVSLSELTSRAERLTGQLAKAHTASRSGDRQGAVSQTAP